MLLVLPSCFDTVILEQKLWAECSFKQIGAYNAAKMQQRDSNNPATVQPRVNTDTGNQEGQNAVGNSAGHRFDGRHSASHSVQWWSREQPREVIRQGGLEDCGAGEHRPKRIPECKAAWRTNTHE